MTCLNDLLQWSAPVIRFNGLPQWPPQWSSPITYASVACASIFQLVLSDCPFWRPRLALMSRRLAQPKSSRPPPRSVLLVRRPRPAIVACRSQLSCQVQSNPGHSFPSSVNCRSSLPARCLRQPRLASPRLALTALTGLVCRSIVQSVSRPVGQSSSRSIVQSVNRPVGQSASRPVGCLLKAKCAKPPTTGLD